MYQLCALKKKIVFIRLTFKLEVLHGAFRQRVERVSRDVGRSVKHVGLPLQQLIQDVPCRDTKVKSYHTYLGGSLHLHKNEKLAVASSIDLSFPSSSSLLSRQQGT